MSATNKLAMLVLSCDGYSDLWDDFFNLRDKYWADCSYKWYLVTESKDYQRDGVEVIKCGKELNWAGRFRYAINLINAEYYGLFLEDYFITETIDTKLIDSLIDIMGRYDVSLLNMSDVFGTILNMKNKQYLMEHLIRIPNNKLYGVSTASAIWRHDFLANKLGNYDYSAWQFEVDRFNDAQSENGYGGVLLCDDRMPFHVSTIPVVTQGMYTPASIRYFKKKGVIINGSGRKVMSEWQYFIFNLKLKLSNVKFGKKGMRWIGSTFFGMKYFTK